MGISGQSHFQVSNECDMIMITAACMQQCIIKLDIKSSDLHMDEERIELQNKL